LDHSICLCTSSINSVIISRDITCVIFWELLYGYSIIYHHNYSLSAFIKMNAVNAFLFLIIFSIAY